VTDTPIRVLFVCTHNSARSQIAEALLGKLGGRDFEARSAGTEATRMNPFAIRVLDEIGIDWSAAFSKAITEFLGHRFDYVITVCDSAREACPVFPGARQMLHWGLDDPSRVEGTEEQRLAAFRRTRDEVEALIRQFIEVSLRPGARVALPPAAPTRRS
jgi:arsenate reductase